MLNSTFDENEVLNSFLAKGYHNGNYYTNKRWGRVECAGSLYSSAKEMANFIKFINNHREFENKDILNKSTISNMLSAQNKSIVLDQNFRIGLGWFLSYPSLEYAGKACGHSGGTALYNSALITVPEHKLGVVLLVNSSSSLKICEDIAKEVLKYSLKIRKGIVSTEKEKEKTSIITPSEDLTNKLKGFYTLGKGGITTIYKKNKKLLATCKGKKVRLVYHSNGTFTFKRHVLGIIPISINNVKVSFLDLNDNIYIILHQKNGIKNVSGYKLKQQDIPVAWEKRTGQYTASNQSSSFYIEIKDGFLFFGSYVLIPLNDHEAVFTGFDRGIGGETILVSEENGKEILTHHGIVIRRTE